MRALSLLLVCCLAVPAQAEVVRFERLSSEVLADEQGFGERGVYEEVRGLLHFAVDPADPRNALIADIALAPRNDAGKVEFTAELVVWKPVDMSRGNGVTLIDIPNRGSQPASGFNKPAPGAPLGDAFLLHEGYTVAWIGWEYDVPNPAGIGIDVPSVPGVANSDLAGLGFAAVRDAGSWIKHDPGALFTTSHLLAFGLSQSGRFLRNYLYLGFNADEAGRQVFDGMIPHIAGASRIDLNRRGAEPVSQGQYTATAYPFTDAALTDPVSGVREGLLENPRAAGSMPKLFYTNSAVEYWGGGRVAALTHTLPDGSADLALGENVRNYFFAGTQHGPAAFPPSEPTNGQLRPNPLDYWWHLRALLTALKDWVIDDVAPPASRHPSLVDGTLVTPGAVNFPALTGVHGVTGLDAGVRVANPLLAGKDGAGAPLPLLVPQVDADGNDLAGIRHPELAVPLATYTGWNFSHPDRGDPDQLFPLAGGWIPFSPDEATRRANGDPRPSIAARYTGRADYLARVNRAGEELVAGRYLRAADLPAIVARAGAQWDLLTAPAP